MPSLQDDTREYHLMIRSGTVTVRVGTAIRDLPVSIGLPPRAREPVSVHCDLMPAPLGLRAMVRLLNETGLPLEILDATLDTTLGLSPGLPVLVNGWQSWSASSLRTPAEPLPRPGFRVRPFERMAGDAAFLPYDRTRLTGWTYTWFREPGGFSLILSLDETQAFTRFDYRKDPRTGETRLTIGKDMAGFRLAPVPRLPEAGDACLFDLYMGYGEEEACADAAFALFHKLRENAGGPPCPAFRPALAYDSWYGLYSRVTERALRSVLEEYRIREIPLDYFLVGPGWEAAAGDWMATGPGFPGGLGRLFDDIRDAGFQPGLTLSPFVCSRRSQLFAERKEFLARDERGRILTAGRSASMGGDLAVLDIARPACRQHLVRVLQTLTSRWGAGILRLDHLYAAALAGGRDRTRAQAMADAMDVLREGMGDRPMIACGVPLGSAMGVAEYVSVGADLSESWDPGAPGRRGFRERESTDSCLRSVMARRHLDGRAFMADPGVFSMRTLPGRGASDDREALFQVCTLFGGFLCTAENIGTCSLQALDRFRTAIARRGSRPRDKRILDVEALSPDDGGRRRFRVRYRLKGVDCQEEIVLPPPAGPV